MRQTWGAIYGRLSTALGWTFPQIDELLFTDIEGLSSYWRTSPPVHELVAAYLEFERKPAEPDMPFDPEQQQVELADLIRSFT